MKTWMKTSIATALIATSALGASAVLARGGDCDRHGPDGGRSGWHKMAPEQMSARIADRAGTQLARLELALALTPEQQPAWAKFKESMLARASEMGERMAEYREAERPKTALERLQRMEEMSKGHQAQLGETRSAVEAFYGGLSDAQKKVFDADFHMGPRGRGDDGKGHGMRDGMRHGKDEGKGPGRG